RPTLFFRRKSLGGEGVKEAVQRIAERVTAARGYELVDVEVKREPRGHRVRLFVDKEGGVGLDDLQSVSEEVSAILDADDPVDSSYTAEVYSSALDRPLR